MSEATIKLLNYINEGKTCNEICQLLGISNKQLYNNLTNLRNKGLFYKRKYYSDGNIIYKPIKGIKDVNNYYNSNESAIITSHDENKVQILLISDLHYGNDLERLDLVDRSYNYCIKKGINLIFCCGDIIDGSYGKGDKKIANIYDQIEYFIKKYPFDKNILTFGVGGDHDFSSLYSGGQNFLEIVKNYRHDIVIPTYNNAFVSLKNDKIHLHHFHEFGKKIITDSSIMLCGHYHKYTSCLNHGVLNIGVPSLSSINSSLPTAVEMNLTFEKGFIKYVNLRQIYFGNDDYILNEVTYNILENKDVQFRHIENEEVKLSISQEENIITQGEDLEQSEKGKQLTKTLSQVEKFNQRWGL